MISQDVTDKIDMLVEAQNKLAETMTLLQALVEFGVPLPCAELWSAASEDVQDELVRFIKLLDRVALQQV